LRHQDRSGDQVRMRARALILLGCLFLVGSVARAAEPIVIGEINPVTGALALQGTSVHQGIVLAVEEQNARGGIAGRTVTPLARRQKDTLERAGIRISVFEPFAPGLSDFTPLLARVRDAGAQVLLSDTFFGDHLLLVRQMAQTGITVKAFLGAFGMEFPGVIRELGAASEGLYGTTAWPGVNPGPQEAPSRAFIDAYAKRFGAQPVPL